jgi:hypothetical protein
LTIHFLNANKSFFTEKESITVHKHYHHDDHGVCRLGHARCPESISGVDWSGHIEAKGHMYAAGGRLQ